MTNNINKINDLEGKMPPQAIDLEEAVLGAVMLENCINEVSEILDINSFYSNIHNRIYNAIITLHTANKPIDILTVTLELKKTKELESVGGAYYITQLTNRVASAANVEFHARIIQQKFIQRELIRISSDVINRCYDDGADCFDILNFLEKGLTGISNSVSIGKITKMLTLWNDISERNELILKNKGLSGISTGFDRLDKITGGWQNANLIILAARPAMGKTALAVNFARNAVISGITTLFFSLEMSALQIGQRIFSMESNISNHDFSRNGISPDQMILIEKDCCKLINSPFYIDDTPAVALSDLRSKARKLKREKGLKMLIIDYLQLMTGDKNFKTNREQEISSISRGLKSLAKELNIPIIALSQLSRKTEDRSDKRPQLSDLRECLSFKTSNIYTNKSFQCNVASPINLLSLHKNKLKEMQSNNIPKSKNNVFRLKTTTGRFVDCTAIHEVLTSDGYKQLQEIKLTDSIAIARNWENKKGRYIAESKFIGWMLGNGAMYGYGVPNFITRDEIISGFFCAFINQRFGFSPKWHPHSKSKVYQWDITNSPDGNRTPEGNIVTRWLKEHDLWGRKSKDKYIPEWFMETANEKSICELLQGLWETDGSIALGKKKETISYSTTSLTLAHQMLYLTAKIGIICYLDNGFFSDKATTECYKLTINGSEEKRNFIKKIKLDGDKGEKLKALKLTYRQSYYSNILGRDTTLNIAADLKKYSTHRFIGSHGKRRLTTTSLIGVFKKFDKDCCINAVKDKYEWLISNSIYWDKVESIEAIGEVEIFDRNVPESNNFVVNGIIVHNSGAIEQDADMVIFIHRPEYYKITEDENGNDLRGIAEIDFAKHRNGGVGTERLRWIDYVTKFENLEIENNVKMMPNINFLESKRESEYPF